LGKLQFPHDFDEEFDLLPVTYAHLHALELLPLVHRDPFDRLLIAQSMAENVPIVTNNEVFSRYRVRTVW
jgi:PIN domain nuclease of toxin-antitoxin system